MAWNLPPDQNAMGGVYGAQGAPLWLQSGMQEAPPNGPAQRLLDPFNPPRRVGIGESIVNALIPRRDEQGIPQAPRVGDFVNAALWALPGMRGGRAPAFAAEKGAGSGGGGRSNWLSDLIAEKNAPASPPNAAIERGAPSPSEVPGEWRKMGQAAYDEGFTHAKRGIGRRQGVYDQTNYDKGFFMGRDGKK